MTNKRITSIDEYSYKGTDHVTLQTADDWIYRFQRPEEHEPYRFEFRQDPDGNRSEERRRLPQKVIDYMDDHYDTAQFRHEMQKHDSTHR